MQLLQDFRLCLSFCSRLYPAFSAEAEDFAGAMRVMPMVGLVIGLVVVGPFWMGLFGTDSALAAFLAVVGNLWVTRGLHHDGLSDVGDAWGSGARGERFIEILKDSRIGAFGVMALILGMGGQWLLLGRAFEQQAFGAAVFAFVFGRFACSVVACICRRLTRPGLGQLFLSGATPRAVAFCALQTLIAGMILTTPMVMLASCVAAAIILCPVVLLARREGFMNGDFLGLSIIWGELAALLGLAAL